MANFRLATLASFVGGLNLRADQPSLAPEESPDMLNVDVDPRGGVHSRAGVAPFATVATTNPIDGLFEFTRANGMHQLLSSQAGRMSRWDTSVWTTFGPVVTTTNTPSMTMFDDIAYFSNGKDVPWTYDGAAYPQLVDV
jgi:hypothetical protein